MVRFAICDDDAAYMKQIVKIIKDTYESMSDFNEPCECILYNSGEELIKNFIEDKIDIFFLDIECGQDLGFDIAKELQKQKKDLGIVYITNHENYMASAFVCRPLGFICKKAAKEPAFFSRSIRKIVRCEHQHSNKKNRPNFHRPKDKK